MLIMYKVNKTFSKIDQFAIICMDSIKHPGLPFLEAWQLLFGRSGQMFGSVMLSNLGLL